MSQFSPPIPSPLIKQDQYDIIDLSDNDIGRLENLPALSKLNTLFLTNNKINRIAPGLGRNVPHLNMLMLINNRLSVRFVSFGALWADHQHSSNQKLETDVFFDSPYPMLQL